MSKTKHTLDLVYMTCKMCIDQGLTDLQDSRLIVGATLEGDLFIGCQRHMVPVTVLPNERIASIVAAIGMQMCEDPDHKETVH